MQQLVPVFVDRYTQSRITRIRLRDIPILFPFSVEETHVRPNTLDVMFRNEKRTLNFAAVMALWVSMTLSEVNFIRADRFVYYQKSRGNPSWYVSSKQSLGGSPGPNMFTSTNPELNSDYHFRLGSLKYFSASSTIYTIPAASFLKCFYNQSINLKLTENILSKASIPFWNQKKSINVVLCKPFIYT